MAQPTFGVNLEVRVLGGKGFAKGVKGKSINVTVVVHGHEATSKNSKIGSGSFDLDSNMTFEMDQANALRLQKENYNIEVCVQIGGRRIGAASIPFPSIPEIRRGIDPKDYPIQITDPDGTQKWGEPSLHVGMRGGFMQLKSGTESGTVTTKTETREAGTSGAAIDRLAQARAKAHHLVVTKAKYTGDKAEGELSFAKGEVIQVLEEGTDGWWKGKLVQSGAVGIFPSNFTKPKPQDDGSASSTADSGEKKQVIARAGYNGGSGDLSFKKGDIITVIQQDGSGWWKGSLNGKQGSFPSNFVKPYDPEATVSEKLNRASTKAKKLRVARAAYKADDDDELSLAKGDVIEVLEEDEDGWWTGRLVESGKTGTFPENYTKPYDGDAPETPAKKNASDAKKDDSDTKDQPATKEAIVKEKLDRASTKAKKLRITKAAYKADDADELSFAKGDIIEVLEEDEDGWWTGRHVESGRTGQFPENYTKPYEGEGADPIAVKGKLQDAQPRAKKLRITKAAYKADDDDELSFAKGDVIEVLEEDEDGWWTGRHVESGKTGTFPENYTKPYDGDAPVTPAKKNTSDAKKAEEEEKDRAEQEAAATKMQAAFRGHEARKQVAAKKAEERAEQDAAATKMQAAFRGREARKQVAAKKAEQGQKDSSKEDEAAAKKKAEEEGQEKEKAEQEAAATKMQAAFRGHEARKQVAAKKAEERAEQDAAATKMQAAFRGREARKQVAAKKAEQERSSADNKAPPSVEDDDSDSDSSFEDFGSLSGTKSTRSSKEAKKEPEPRPAKVSSPKASPKASPKSSPKPARNESRESLARRSGPEPEPEPVRAAPPTRESPVRATRPSSASSREASPDRVQRTPSQGGLARTSSSSTTKSKRAGHVAFEDNPVRSPPRRPQSATARSPARPARAESPPSQQTREYHGGHETASPPPRAPRPQSATARSPAPRAQSRPKSATARTPVSTANTRAQPYDPGRVIDTELYGPDGEPIQKERGPKKAALDDYADGAQSAQGSPSRRRPQSAGPIKTRANGTPRSRTMPAQRPNSGRQQPQQANGALPRDSNRPAQSPRQRTAASRTAAANGRGRPSSARMAPAPPSSSPTNRRARPTTSVGGRTTQERKVAQAAAGHDSGAEDYSDTGSPRARPTLSNEERDRILPQAVMLLTKAIHYGDARYLEATVDILSSVSIRASARQRERDRSESPLAAARAASGRPMTARRSARANGVGAANGGTHSDAFREWLRRKKQEDRQNATTTQRVKIRRQTPMTKRQQRKAIQRAEQGWDSRLTTPTVPRNR